MIKPLTERVPIRIESQALEQKVLLLKARRFNENIEKLKQELKTS
jgi:hypothetical protein